MRQLTFNARFVQNMLWCRIAVYLCFGVLGLANVHLLNLQVNVSTSAMVAGGLLFCVFPAGVYALLRGPRAVWLCVGIHVVECAVLVLFAVWSRLSLFSALWLLVIIFAANTALWSWRQLPLFMVVALAAGTGALLVAGLSVPGWQAAGFWLDAWAVCAGAIFVLAICGVAHTQAQQFISMSRHLHHEKQTLLRYLPRDLPLHLHHTKAQDVRRVWMSVVFVDLVGFTRATRELPPEALAGLLNDFLTCINQHVEDWGGIVSKFLGDGVLCVFPGEAVAERRNAALQAVRCVSLLPALLADLNRHWHTAGHLQHYAVTCGVAAGYCCAGDWGGSDRLDYTVIGLPVNLAQRLQSMAAPEEGANVQNGILLDETTWLLTGDAVATGPATAYTLKGLGSITGYALLLESGVSVSTDSMHRVCL